MTKKKRELDNLSERLRHFTEETFSALGGLVR